MSAVSLTERYVASMVLSGVGDAMGYKNAGWEFNFVGASIHEECQKLGGVANLKINRKCYIHVHNYSIVFSFILLFIYLFLLLLLAF